MLEVTELNMPRSLQSQTLPPQCWLAVALHDGEETIVGAACDKWEAMMRAATHGFFKIVVRRLRDGSELVQ